MEKFVESVPPFQFQKILPTPSSVRMSPLLPSSTLWNEKVTCTFGGSIEIKVDTTDDGGFLTTQTFKDCKEDIPLCSGVFTFKGETKNTTHFCSKGEGLCSEGGIEGEILGFYEDEEGQVSVTTSLFFENITFVALFDSFPCSGCPYKYNVLLFAKGGKFLYATTGVYLDAFPKDVSVNLEFSLDSFPEYKKTQMSISITGTLSASFGPNLEEGLLCASEQKLEIETVKPLEIEFDMESKRQTVISEGIYRINKNIKLVIRQDEIEIYINEKLLKKIKFSKGECPKGSSVSC